MLKAATNGHERLEKAARALNVTSQSSGVILTRNTARPHDGEVICTYHFLRRVGPCPFHRSAQDLTLRCGTRKPAKGQVPKALMRRARLSPQRLDRFWY